VIIKTPSTYDFKWNKFCSFSLRLWIAVCFTMVLLSISLALINSLSHWYGLPDDGDYTHTKAVFVVIGAFCQKGNLLRR